jgi:DNA polymerase-3 subunit gamma/tau
MAYQAIYRKWRPLVFEDVIGQSHITQTLKNQITSGKIAHAYLFCGTRGTGKTSMAKIFARAVNCVSNTSGSPCNKCSVCKGILDGSILDVTEIDAASNNGVDSIREIRDEVSYVAAQTKYRIYIIDEVHMLSTGAFNALLKTLEEPPEHVIFILATTEVHKVPQTILSRCQRFDFKRIRPHDIIVRMKEIASADGYHLSDGAYSLLSQLAEGSMRDALSIMERCVSSRGNSLNEDDIRDVLGIAGNQAVIDMTDAMISSNSEQMLSLIERLISDGRDLYTFIESFLKYLRDVSVCKISNEPERFMDYSEDTLTLVKRQADKLSQEKLAHAVDIISQAHAGAKWLKAPRIVYELALIKIVAPELDNSNTAMIDRLHAIEDKIKNGVAAAPASAALLQETVKPETSKKKKVSKRLFVPLTEEQKSSSNPIVIAAKKWDRLAPSIGNSSPHLSPCMKNRPITVDGDGIIMLFEKNEAMSKKITDKFLPDIETAYAKASGVSLKIKTAFKIDIEDYIVDYWTFPDIEHDNAEPADPLDTLAEEYPEIVEITDDSEFIDYQPNQDDFSQSVIEDDEDNREEEFLDEYEQNQ